MAQTPSKSCEFCNKPATLYCYEDKQFLCSQCRKDIHDRVTVCRDHNVVDIHKAGNHIYKPVPFRRAIIDGIDKQFQIGLKELETSVVVLTGEVDILNEKLKGKQEEIDNLSKQKEKETIVARLRDEMDALKGKLKIKQQEIDNLSETNQVSPNTSLGMIEEGTENTMRIVLIGSTGVGKSSLGNTLLGGHYFHENEGPKSVTMKCEIFESIVGKRKIQVVDTPPISNSDRENMTSAISLFFDLLAPGPHAIIIVFSPCRPSYAMKRDIEILIKFFGDDQFLDSTMLVMGRKNVIIGKFGKSDNIYDYVENESPEIIKQLYMKCNKRIVAVENSQNMTGRQKDAERVFEVIDKLEGYYSQRYFQNLSEEKRNSEVITQLEKSITEQEQHEQQKEELENSSNCKPM